jgi:hypothetical protein
MFSTTVPPIGRTFALFACARQCIAVSIEFPIDHIVACSSFAIDCTALVVLLAMTHKKRGRFRLYLYMPYGSGAPSSNTKRFAGIFQKNVVELSEGRYQAC